MLATYLHDSISAKHYKVEPTGNGRRESYRFPPMPRMRATYMLPGPHKPDEIIASVKKGLYCERFTNGQVQIGAGDFTFYVKNGYLIEDGKLTRPVKDVNIIGNGPKVLEQVDMVGRRPGDRRGRLDLRQERPVGSGLAGDPDGPRGVDHGRRPRRKGVARVAIAGHPRRCRARLVLDVAPLRLRAGCALRLAADPLSPPLQSRCERPESTAPEWS